MERLTKCVTNKQTIMDCEKCKADWTGKHGKSMVDCTPLYCRNRLKDRLAAYEDTGLTPEQCESAKNIIEYAFSDDTSKAERIRELLKADKDGRLVVLPCKVGDTVWMYEEAFGIVLPYTIDLISFVGKGCGYSANCNHNGELIDSIDFEDDDIGKTVFLTREEAESALEEMKDE
mgnify:CR=1 FL=1